ncbi:Na(+)-translocating NADH-quinone reductase subunit A [Simiduia litorea]|uniref:Na(+)-translocating NADH-quinone reductase subunit A n=1 Tax=Simiduia litorea TaxID=1435348 RepID=UPI0036F3D61A
MIKIRRGLDLPISGAPEQTIHDAPKARSVAVLGVDYHGMKPTMAVKEGDKVKLGQLLFSDKKTEGVRYTAPAAGTIAAINRGEKRVLQSVVIDVEGDEAEQFERYAPTEFAGLSADTVQSNLVNSGLWTALRTRPFSKVPALGSRPASIFVTAMDTNPLAADPALIIAEHAEAFAQGLTLLSRLTEGQVHVCKAAGSAVSAAGDRIAVHEFGGVHPAGNAGTHIHFIDPVSVKKTVWSVGYQDVIAIAKLFTTGTLFTDRVISLAGPQVAQPRLVRTRLGANLDELTAGQLKEGENRIVTGSVFGGRTARGAFAYLGRYHQQVSVLVEGRDRPFLHYMRAGFNMFSTTGIYISKLLGGGKKYDFTTTTAGSERAMVPIGTYERIMPLDILPTHLLRAIIVGDTDMAQKLGALELDEDDLALCTYVCPGKYEYGPILRDNLTRIEKEG